VTRWAIVADLRRCVGCQTCTAACKQANNTPAGVQWRRVLDLESGEYPEVKRAFVPVGCMHCDDPPCMHVCPSTATRKRADGIVTIDENLCIGCGYCMVACPYDARAKVGGIATKCTFCVDRIDSGLAKGLKPGLDPEATPACVNSCIAKALHFGDADDPQSNISQLLAEHQSFRMHEELETGPNIHYLWDKSQ
jgi:phenylacetyl-CoA:acceptor oxidoreductase subunit 1